MKRRFADSVPQIVNHHAAQINVRDSVENPGFDADVNIGGSLNVLRLCAEYKTEKFIFSSTGGALYGEPEKLPADESTPRPSPLPIRHLETLNGTLREISFEKPRFWTRDPEIRKRFTEKGRTPREKPA